MEIIQKNYSLNLYGMTVKTPCHMFCFIKLMYTQFTRALGHKRATYIPMATLP